MGNLFKRDSLKMFGYNINLIVTPSYIVFIFAALMIPLFLNLTLSMYFEMIIPICSVIMFANIMMIEKDYDVYKNVNIASYKNGNIFLIRLLINFLFYLIISILFYIYIVKIINYKFSVDHFYSYDDIGFFEAVFVVGGISFLHIGLVAATIANKTQNVYAGVIVGYIYASTWIGLSSRFQNIMINPYPYASYSDHIIGSKLFITAVNIILATYNYRICNKSLYIIE